MEGMLRIGLFSLLFSQCVGPMTKEECRETFNNESFYIIVEEKSRNGRAFMLRGKNKEGQPDSYGSTGGSAFLKTLRFVQVGDTFCKEEGTLEYFVKKKDTTLVFSFKGFCDKGL